MPPSSGCWCCCRCCSRPPPRPPRRSRSTSRDNATACTRHIAAAFDACAAAGGGRVVVPPDTFVTGEVELRSGCYLLLLAGGVLQGSTDPREYGDDWDFWCVVVDVNVSNTGAIAPSFAIRGGAGGGGEIRGALANCWAANAKAADADANADRSLLQASCGNSLKGSTPRATASSRRAGRT